MIRKPELIAPVTLAYVGDTLYDLFVRTYLISTSTYGVSKLHVMATGLVCAAAQAAAFHKVEDMLTEEETAMYKRGRNAHSTPPKNADVINYKIATGFETLIGYLYFSGKDERIAQLMAVVLSDK